MIKKIESENLASSRLVVRLARNKKEIKAAQKLRYMVFAEELGANISSRKKGLDIDKYDKYCLHLIVLDEIREKIVGTYRILLPEGAKKAGGWYSANEFDLSPLIPIMDDMIEIGRACVHKDYRLSSAVILLWSGLIQLLKNHKLNYMIGCASVTMDDGGNIAASLYKKIEKKHLCSAEYLVRPLNPLNIDELSIDTSIEYPTLIRGYLKLGAFICGVPTVDKEFNTADMLILFNLKEANKRFLKKLDKN